jgi:N-methylhydantoinase A
MTLGADSTAGRFRIGVDIGGTFTDFALFDDALGRARTHKRLTTTKAPAQAVIEGIAAITAEAGLAVADLATIVHGTTLVTNAILERKGAPTAMLVTEGFRDTLEMAYERRYDLFDLRLRFPAPIVPRRLRFEVPGRLRADGSEEAPLALSDALERKLRQAVETYGVRAVVVCYLHAYRNDRHEKATERTP